MPMKATLTVVSSESQLALCLVSEMVGKMVRREGYAGEFWFNGGS